MVISNKIWYNVNVEQETPTITTNGIYPPDSFIYTELREAIYHERRKQ